MRFERNVGVGAREAQTLAALTDRASSLGGLVVVSTVSDWLSLTLRVDELELKKPSTPEEEPYLDRVLRESLLAVVRSDWRDVYDESDLMFHPRLQLVYALGGQITLPQAHLRWHVVLALCDVEPGAPGDVVQCTPSELLEAILAGQSSWITWPEMDEANLDLIRDLVLGVDADAGPKLKAMAGSDLSHRILALRGLLGCGVYASTQALRYGVSYGLRPGEPRAVPFRACDSPAERALFAHPDVTLLLTARSYLAKGLTKDAIREAVGALLSKSKEAQDQEYGRWLDGLGDDVEVPEALNSSAKLDTTNTTQMTVVHELFWRNARTVAFWLDACLFPTTTATFVAQLSRSAFDVGPGAGQTRALCCGFAGTKEAEALYPLGVEAEQLPSLHATDGRMLGLALGCGSVLSEWEAVPLPNALAKAGFPPLASQVLAAALGAEGVVGIVDVGGLLAGVDLGTAAKVLLACEEVCRRPVAFFDDGWKVAEPHGGVGPKAASTWRDDELFVIYDEARTRGSDMKLAPTAQVVVTLDSRTTRDAFAQGIGRLRQLGLSQQGFVVAAPSELGVTSMREVLSLVIRQSTKTCNASWSRYTEAGLGAVRSLGAGGFAQREDVLWGLDHLYKGVWQPKSAQVLLERAAGDAHDGAAGGLLEDLRKHVRKHGGLGFESQPRVRHDEVLVELQHEEEAEAEEEAEVEIAETELEDKAWPSWELSNVTPQDVAVPSGSILATYLFGAAEGVENLFFSNNVVRELGCTGDGVLSRRVDAVLKWGKNVVVISVYELEHLLAAHLPEDAEVVHLWDEQRAKSVLGNSVFLRLQLVDGQAWVEMGEEVRVLVLSEVEKAEGVVRQRGRAVSLDSSPVARVVEEERQRQSLVVLAGGSGAT